MAIGPLLFGIARLAAPGYGAYQTWAYGRAVRITGLEIADLWLYRGIRNVVGAAHVWCRATD